MINNIVLEGRLTKDPELMKAGNTDLLNFSLANNYWNGKENTVVFVNCVAWSKQALNICKYLKKGDIMSVEGMLIANKFTKQDGTEVNDLKINVRAVHFGNNQPTNNAKPNDNVRVDPTLNNTTTVTPNSNFDLNDDGLPF